MVRTKYDNKSFCGRAKKFEKAIKRLKEKARIIGHNIDKCMKRSIAKKKIALRKMNEKEPYKWTAFAGFDIPATDSDLRIIEKEENKYIKRHFNDVIEI